jgi:hypothetical protein
MIAPLRSLDELWLIHARLACGTARVVVLNSVWRRCPLKRSPGATGPHVRGRGTPMRSVGTTSVAP